MDEGSYEEYKREQIRLNEAKFDKVWVFREELVRLVKMLKKTVSPLACGICHGSRNGFEVDELTKLLGIQVVGTDIAPSAERHPHMFQWDFHEVKPEWRGHWDFIYSNSFDHSYDPKLCLERWMGTLAPNGVCVIHQNGMPEFQAVAGDCALVVPSDYKRLAEACRYEIVPSGHGRRIFVAVRHKQKEAGDAQT
jgi:hypothetical protein